MHKFLVHQKGDHVGVAVRPIEKGEEAQGVYLDGEGTITVVARDDVPYGHKIAIRDTNSDPTVLKYGIKIGNAVEPLRVGDYVHTHNLKSARW